MQDFPAPHPTPDDTPPPKPVKREIPAAYLILTNESVDNWCAAITSTKKLIGRKSRCHIVIPPKFLSVSREHAFIWGDSSGIMLRDNDSTAGTRINGVSIGKGKDAKVVVGDRICLGALELQVTDNLPIQRQVFAETGVLIDESMDSVNPFAATTPRSTLMASLTKAEFTIVLWIGRGYVRDEEIAEQLNRSRNTIRTQVNSIFRKLGVHSRVDLVNMIRSPHFDTAGDTVDKPPKPNKK